MANNKNEAQVVIIGAGPAGATLGCYLSRAGIPNLIVDSAMHPRPHVGESLVSSTTRVFDELGFLPTMEAEGFPKKYGASWHAPGKANEFAIRFEEFPQPGVNQPYTYHVDRSRFDLLLLKHAESLGSKVLQGVRVQEVLFEGEKANGVALDVAGQRVEVPAKVVVDASGRHTLLGRQLGLKIPDENFNQFAVHTWFEDLDRGETESKDYIHIYFLPVERGWAWQIPITDEITSVGVVTEKAEFKKSGKDPEAWFKSHLESTPDFARAMRNAKPIREFKREADYSYCMSKFAGDGWVLIGDAARFVDPIFSSGVSVAMASAKMASEPIIKAVEENAPQVATFANYEETLRAGVANWYEFIRLYYRLMPLFTVFISSEKHRHGILQLLQGEVFERGEVPVLKAMRDYIETVEQSESHMMKPWLRESAPAAAPAM